MGARRGDLFLSEPEIKAQTLRRVAIKGRANLTETAICLGLSQPTIRAHVEMGKIRTMQFKRLHYVSIEELRRLGAPL